MRLPHPHLTCSCPLRIHPDGRVPVKRTTTEPSTRELHSPGALDRQSTDRRRPRVFTDARPDSGDHTGGATPVPIPNTAVKPVGPMIVPLARKSVIAGNYTKTPVSHDAGVFLFACRFAAGRSRSARTSTNGRGAPRVCTESRTMCGAVRCKSRSQRKIDVRKSERPAGSPQVPSSAQGRLRRSLRDVPRRWSR